MKTFTVSTARRILTALWASILVGLVVLVAGSHLAPLADREVLIIRGRSMAPAIPLGSVVVVEHVAPSAVRDGDVVTIRLSNGVAVTHRVIRVVELPAGPHFELKGDANESADPNLVPGDALIGRVSHHLPVAGYVLTMLSVPTGMLSLLSMVGGLYLAVWLLEELENRARRSRQRPVLAHADLSA